MKTLVATCVVGWFSFASIASAKNFSCALGKNANDDSDSEIIGEIKVDTDQPNSFNSAEVVTGKLFALCGAASEEEEKGGKANVDLACGFVTPKVGFPGTLERLKELARQDKFEAEYTMRALAITSVESKVLTLFTRLEGDEDASYFIDCH